jgi:hypothetical protein
MKKIANFIGILLLALALSGQTAWAQHQQLTKKEKRHLEQMRKKKERTLEHQASRAYYMELLSKKYFVFEADYLVGPEGQSFILTPNINFMSVNGNNVVLQFGFDGVVGWNGVGGITVRGNLSNYKVDTTRRNNLMVTTDVNLIGPGLPPHITLNVSDDGTAFLTILPATGGPINVYGQIFSPQKAAIFEGQSLF